MLPVTRGFLLFVPLFVAALLGVWHVPPVHTVVDEEDEVDTGNLPPVPRWALRSLPYFDQYQDVTEKKAAFFSYLYSRTVLINTRILLQREHLSALSEKEVLSAEDVRWLTAQAERLRVDEEPGSQPMFEVLLRRLDTLPPSLVLAQAANESAWGTSRFAMEGNNLFGQWCFSPGCGLIPLNRPSGASHEVTVFGTPYHSVRSYIQNLNRHPSYQRLRELRSKARQEGRSPSGTELAAGLSGYSERGQAYIEEIRSMIRFNNLRYYDQHYRDLVGNRRDTEQLVRLATAPEKRLLPGHEQE